MVCRAGDSTPREKKDVSWVTERVLTLIATHIGSGTASMNKAQFWDNLAGPSVEKRGCHNCKHEKVEIGGKRGGRRLYCSLAETESSIFYDCVHSCTIIPSVDSTTSWWEWNGQR